jgi:PAS domain-containing protein
MPRQNRVTPFSSIVSTPARGTLTGNRGCLHDDQQCIRRHFQGTRWIICLLEFKGRRRQLMTPGHYTELFFLDEATALAAGHRPCAECQRERFTRFRDLWAAANPELAGTSRPAATVMDAAIHQERTAPIGHGNRSRISIEHLPDGVFVTDDDRTPYLILAGQFLRWSPAGYERPTAALQYPARVLTPVSVVRTLAAGYSVGIHDSAFDTLA